MEELFSPRSSFSLSSPPSITNTGHPVMEFPYCEVPEPWLLEDIVMTKHGAEGHDDLWHHMDGSFSSVSEVSRHHHHHHHLSPPLAPEQQGQVQVPPPTITVPAQQQGKKRRGRKPCPRPKGVTVNHVEVERQRREKLNRLFCELRAAVPTVTRMDKASLLADAAAYIAELRARVALLEDESRRAASARWEAAVVVAAASPSSCGPAAGGGGGGADEAVEVRMVGADAAAVRATSCGPHAAARLMDALRALDLRVQHACVVRVHGGATVLDVLVDVPAALQDHGGLRGELLHVLQDSGSPAH